MEQKELFLNELDFISNTVLQGARVEHKELFLNELDSASNAVLLVRYRTMPMSMPLHS